MDRVYIAIDLKSFYASVECVIRNLNPLDTNLVVADNSRTEKTICLAVSPSLKEYGIGGRARLFEVVKRINDLNLKRRSNKKSYLKTELENSDLKIDYIIAKPQMALYIKYSAEIYEIYLKYVCKDDIIVYSIDEVFIDVTNYLKAYDIKAQDLALKIVNDVLNKTGITATAGIGSNLYLAKIAMDILAKKMKPDSNGVRIASLDEMMYRKLLWDHKPLTDFWRIGRGTANRLENIGVHTMGDLAYMSVKNEDLLYEMFGINAELIIDHAWGYEPVTIDIIKSYKSSSRSLGSGQVLHCAYDYNKALLIVKEMADQLALDLFNKGYYTNQLVLVISYEANNDFEGAKSIDYYGRIVPKSTHGSINFEYTQSNSEIINNAVLLFNKIVDKTLNARRINISANNIVYEVDIPLKGYEQLDLFIDYDRLNEEIEKRNIALKKEQKRQKAISNIKEKYGKNSVLKGMNLEDGSTAIDRNNQIGGHKA